MVCDIWHMIGAQCQYGFNIWWCSFYHVCSFWRGDLLLSACVCKADKTQRFEQVLSPSVCNLRRDPFAHFQCRYPRYCIPPLLRPRFVGPAFASRCRVRHHTLRHGAAARTGQRACVASKRPCGKKQGHIGVQAAPCQFAAGGSLD